MPLSTGSAILAICLLVIGLVSVQWEVQNIRSGVRVRELLRDEEEKVENLRRLQTEYNTQISPDNLERELPDTFRTPNGFPDKGRTASSGPSEGR
jgi:hypothetical protein